MRAVEYFPLAIKKKNSDIWLILQGGIVIPTECIFEDKMPSTPSALSAFRYLLLLLNYK